jgi:hypothetical protein
MEVYGHSSSIKSQDETFHKSPWSGSQRCVSIPNNLADETVSGEPVSAFNFPARREIGRVFDIF